MPLKVAVRSPIRRTCRYALRLLFSIFVIFLRPIRLIRPPADMMLLYEPVAAAFRIIVRYGEVK